MKRRGILYWPFVVLHELTVKLNSLIGYQNSKELREVEKINQRYDRLEDSKWKYYRRLVRKYPEMTWTKKYVQAGMALVVPGILAQYFADVERLHTIWTDEASLQHALGLLEHGLGFTSVIFLPSGTPHAIAVWGYNQRKGELYFSDSLGNYNSGYRFTYNDLCYIKYEDFVAQNVGANVTITVVMRSEEVEIARHLLSNIAFYFV